MDFQETDIRSSRGHTVTLHLNSVTRLVTETGKKGIFRHCLTMSRQKLKNLLCLIIIWFQTISISENSLFGGKGTNE